MSTKTGWAILEMEKGKCELIDCGVLKQTPEPEGYEYPFSYLKWSNMCFDQIAKIWDTKANPEVVVIEETAKGSRNSFTQKILEFIHFRMALWLQDECEQNPELKYRYYLTEEWRRIAGCQQNAAEKKNNAKRSREKAKAKKKGEATTVIKDKEGNRLGRVTKKHVNVRRCNEVFGTEFILKDEDKADACLLGYAYYKENFE